MIVLAEPLIFLIKPLIFCILKSQQNSCASFRPVDFLEFKLVVSSKIVICLHGGKMAVSS